MTIEWMKAATGAIYGSVIFLDLFSVRASEPRLGNLSQSQAFEEAEALALNSLCHDALLRRVVLEKASIFEQASARRPHFPNISIPFLTYLDNLRGQCYKHDQPPLVVLREANAIVGDSDFIVLIKKSLSITYMDSPNDKKINEDILNLVLSRHWKEPVDKEQCLLLFLNPKLKTVAADGRVDRMKKIMAMDLSDTFWEQAVDQLAHWGESIVHNRYKQQDRSAVLMEFLGLQDRYPLFDKLLPSHKTDNNAGDAWAILPWPTNFNVNTEKILYTSLSEIHFLVQHNTWIFAIRTSNQALLNVTCKFGKITIHLPDRQDFYLNDEKALLHWEYRRTLVITVSAKGWQRLRVEGVSLNQHYSDADFTVIFRKEGDTRNSPGIEHNDKIAAPETPIPPQMVSLKPICVFRS